MPEPNPSVGLHLENNVAVITLNRPGRLNAITVPVMQRLHAALDAADADRRVGAIVLAANGRGFCVGQDLKVLSQMHERQPASRIGELLERTYNAVVERIADCNAPVIAAVQGVAAGAGWALVLACDLSFAASSARFVPAFARLGLIPDLGGSTSLVRTLGYRRAIEFLLLVDELSAHEAQSAGLVNRVVDEDALRPAVMDAAKRIAELPRTGVRLTKRALRSAIAAGPSQLKREAWWQSMAASAPDHAERVALSSLRP